MEEEIDVFDYIVSIPELDAFGLENIDVTESPMEITVRTGRLCVRWHQMTPLFSI